MISQALLVGNFEAAVDICVGADRMVKEVVMVTRLLILLLYRQKL